MTALYVKVTKMYVTVENVFLSVPAKLIMMRPKNAKVGRWKLNMTTQSVELLQDI